MSAEPKAHQKSNGLAKPGKVLLVVIWFGLLSSTVEVLYHVVRKQLGIVWYLRLGRDYVWMTALTDAAIFLVPGLVLFILSWRFQKQDLMRAALFVGSFLFFVKCLLLVGGLHEYAFLLLALGLAVQASWLIKKYLKPLTPIISRTTLFLSMLFVALWVTLVGDRKIAEMQMLASLQSPPKNAPNVILITLDTLCADHVSLYGYHRNTTPNLDKWAKEGVWFKKALTTAPWTLPSHSCMFTGRYPHELSATYRTPLDGTYPTISEIFRDNGYLTGGFVANRFYCSYETGLNRGFIHYESYDHSPGQFMQCSALSSWFLNQMYVRIFFGWYDVYGRKDASEVNESFLDWLDGQEKRPFFAFINFFDAHDPYLPQPPFESKFGAPPSDVDRALSIRWWHVDRNKLSPGRVETAVRAYDSCIAYLDDQLGKLRAELENRGLLDNTVIILTSDHGEHFGEHGLFLHGQSLYRDLLHVPLIIIDPRQISPGSVVEESITLRDLGKTVLDLAGLDKNNNFPGISLSRCWKKTGSLRGVSDGSPIFQVAFPISPGYFCPDFGCSPVASGSIISLLKNGKHYIKNLNTGKEEMFDFDNDPLEQINLALKTESDPFLHDFRVSIQGIFRMYPSRWVDFPPKNP